MAKQLTIVTKAIENNKSVTTYFNNVNKVSGKEPDTENTYNIFEDAVVIKYENKTHHFPLSGIISITEEGENDPEQELILAEPAKKLKKGKK